MEEWIHIKLEKYSLELHGFINHIMVLKWESVKRKSVKP